MFHGQDHLVGTREQVHRTAHAGGFLARDDPVGQVAFFIDLQGSQYRSVHMTAADDAERGGAVEARGALEGRDESAAGIDKFGVFLARCGGRAHTEQAVFALQEDLNAFRQVIGDGRRQSDTEVHHVAVFEFHRHAFGDDFSDLFLFHRFMSFLSVRRTVLKRGGSGIRDRFLFAVHSAGHLLGDERRHVVGVGVHAEAGVIAQLFGQFVRDARAAARQNHFVAQPFGFEHFDQLREVLDMDILLGHRLRNQQGVGLEFDRFGDELFVGRT